MVIFAQPKARGVSNDPKGYVAGTFSARQMNQTKTIFTEGDKTDIILVMMIAASIYFVWWFLTR